MSNYLIFTKVLKSKFNFLQMEKIKITARNSLRKFSPDSTKEIKFERTQIVPLVGLLLNCVGVGKFSQQFSFGVCL